jgi:hypothetical protein
MYILDSRILSIQVHNTENPTVLLLLHRLVFYQVVNAFLIRRLIKQR